MKNSEIINKLSADANEFDDSLVQTAIDRLLLLKRISDERIWMERYLASYLKKFGIIER